MLMRQKPKLIVDAGEPLQNSRFTSSLGRCTIDAIYFHGVSSTTSEAKAPFDVGLVEVTTEEKKERIENGGKP